MQSKIITHRLKGNIQPKPSRQRKLDGQEELARLDALNSFNLYAESSLSKIDELLLDTVTNKKKTPSSYVLSEVKEFNALMTTLNENELFGRYIPGYVVPFRNKLYDLQEKYQTWFTVMSFNEDIAKLYALCKAIAIPSITKKREPVQKKTAHTKTVHIDRPGAEGLSDEERVRTDKRRISAKQDAITGEQNPTAVSFLKNVIGQLNGKKGPGEQ